MLRRLAVFASAAAVAATASLGAPAQAGPCDSDGHIALGVIDIAGVLYIDDRNFVEGNGFWIYLESNGQSGLQRGGSSVMGPDLGGQDPCVESSNPDTIIF